MIFKDKLDNFISGLVDYLGIEKVPIEFSNVIKDDSRLVLQPKVKILVNNKYNNNYLECAKAVTHEYRHWFQLNWVSYMDDNLSKRWSKAFKNAISLENADLLNNIEESTTYAMQDIEIDAFAFTKYYLEKYEGLVVIHPNEQYEDIIRLYITSNLHIM